jgi:methylmalonyl-CoA/ethylmalonyl-CoA epimerase
MNRLHHLAVCVHELEAALPLWRDGLGFVLDSIEDLPERKVRVAMLRLGDTRIELVQPTADDSEVSGFLAKRGEGLHHLALAVDDLDAALSQAVDGGAKAVPAPERVGAGGARVAFLHPRAANGVLVELVEDGARHGT